MNVGRSLRHTISRQSPSLCSRRRGETKQERKRKGERESRERSGARLLDLHADVGDFESALEAVEYSLAILEAVAILVLNMLVPEKLRKHRENLEILGFQ